MDDMTLLGQKLAVLAYLKRRVREEEAAIKTELAAMTHPGSLKVPGITGDYTADIGTVVCVPEKTETVYEVTNDEAYGTWLTMHGVDAPVVWEPRRVAARWADPDYIEKRVAETGEVPEGVHMRERTTGQRVYARQSASQRENLERSVSGMAQLGRVLDQPLIETGSSDE